MCAEQPGGHCDQRGDDMGFVLGLTQTLQGVQCSGQGCGLISDSEGHATAVAAD